MLALQIPKRMRFSEDNKVFTLLRPLFIMFVHIIYTDVINIKQY